jgi:hypothetical protein
MRKERLLALCFGRTVFLCERLLVPSVLLLKVLWQALFHELFRERLVTGFKRFNKFCRFKKNKKLNHDCYIL